MAQTSMLKSCDNTKSANCKKVMLWKRRFRFLVQSYVTAAYLIGIIMGWITIYFLIDLTIIWTTGIFSSFNFKDILFLRKTLAKLLLVETVRNSLHLTEHVAIAIIM